jgi:hypothetical protein
VFIGAVWSPIVEEILFRGMVQGKLTKKRWGRAKFLIVSRANWVSSARFVIAHFWCQPGRWVLTLVMQARANCRTCTVDECLGWLAPGYLANSFDCLLFQYQPLIGMCQSLILAHRHPHAERAGNAGTKHQGKPGKVRF